MSVQSVRDFFSDLNLPVQIVELEVSTATVALAAQAHGVEPGRIAKTLAFLTGTKWMIEVEQCHRRFNVRNTATL